MAARPMCRSPTDGDGYEIVVEDEGPGIPEDDQQRVFEPFVRLESSRNADTGGTGLGLTLVKAIAEGHGGGVTLENRAGRRPARPAAFAARWRQPPRSCVAMQFGTVPVAGAAGAILAHGVRAGALSLPQGPRPVGRTISADLARCGRARR